MKGKLGNRRAILCEVSPSHNIGTEWLGNFKSGSTGLEPDLQRHYLLISIFVPDHFGISTSARAVSRLNGNQALFGIIS
jgi:hypothetical protein